MTKICNCPIRNCGCVGDMHSYVPYYKAVLEILKPNNVMEWGPGLNTQMALDVGASVTSVEHDKEWIPSSGHPRFACIWVPEDHESYTKLWSPADLYFVDGRRREECLEVICHKSSGIVCLHDAQRKRYQDSLNKFKYVRHLIFGFAIASHCDKVVDIADKIGKGV